ncbi:MAG TPA: HD domain-containing phosphohydrolase [Coriobacteriia bacterium]|nr:HD domain-containing phosphohydrolase [Coriobacteriia bacterium]
MRRTWLIIAAALSVLFPIAYAASRTLAPAHTAVLPQVLYLVPFFATVLLVLACTRFEGRERAFWILMTVTLALITLAETAYSVLAVTGGTEPGWQPLLVVPYLLAGVLFIPSIQILTHLASEPRARRTGHVIDLAVIVVVGFLVEEVVFTGPMFLVHGAPLESALFTTLFSIYGLLIAAFMVQGLLVAHVLRWRQWERIMAASILLYGGSTLLSPIQHLSQIHLFPDWSGTLIESLWVAAFGGMGIAAIFRLTAAQGPGEHVFSGERARRRPWTSNSVVAVATLAIGYCLWSAPHSTGMQYDIYVLSATVLLVLVALRYFIVNNAFAGTAELSRTDPVTGLGNRRAIQDFLDHEAADAIRFGAPFTLMVLQVSGISRITMAMGRAERDRVLAAIAARIRPIIGTDMAARASGAEFIFGISQANATQVLPMALDIRDSVMAFCAEEGVPVVTSIGVASFPTHALDADTLLQQARSAAEWSRSEGRHKVTVFDNRIFGAEAQANTAMVMGLRERALRAVVASLDASVPGREYRSSNVQMLATALAHELGMGEEHASRVGYAASVCDVGLVVVSTDAHLSISDPASFDLGEHAAISGRILTGVGEADIGGWVRSHHERWDGTGHPDGLAGEAIPLESRIIAICDLYDELVSGRPGASAVSPAAALQQLDLELGSRFDPVAGERFIRMVSELLEVSSRTERPHRLGHNPTASP